MISLVENRGGYEIKSNLMEMTNIDILMNTLDVVKSSLLSKNTILQTFLTVVVPSEFQQEFEHNIKNLCSTLFSKRQKISRYELREAITKTGFCVDVKD